MPSRAVEAALILAVSMAATIVAFVNLRSYLFPQRALSLETLRDNVEAFASILERGGGKLRLQAKYFVKYDGYPARITVKVFEEGENPIWYYEYTITLPVVYVQLGERRETTLLRGELAPFSSTGASTLVVIEDDKMKMILRPMVQVGSCDFYGLKCKSIVVSFPRLKVLRGGSVLDSVVLAEGQVIEVFVNRSVSFPQEVKYGRRIEVSFKLTSPADGGDTKVWELLGIPMERQISIDLDDNGAFLIQYTLEEIVIKI